MEVYFTTEKLLHDEKFLFTLGCDYQAEHPEVKHFDCYRVNLEHMPAIILFDSSKKKLTKSLIKPLFNSVDGKTHIVRQIIRAKRINGELKLNLSYIPLDDLKDYVTLTSENYHLNF